jgi:hypothetical protein
MSDRRNLRVRAHFDGRAFVPEGPIHLLPDDKVILNVEPDPSASRPPEHGTAAYVFEMMRGHEINDEDAELMRAAIEDAFEHVEPDPDIDLDAGRP